MSYVYDRVDTKEDEKSFASIETIPTPQKDAAVHPFLEGYRIWPMLLFNAWNDILILGPPPPE